jgi:protein-S-isoprenylcysteine O-methyltransferase Ste14
MVLSLSEPAAASPYWLTVGVWAIGERVLTFRDLRSGAWKSRQDAGSQRAIALCFVVGFFAALGFATLGVLGLPEPAVWLAVGLIIGWAGMLFRLWAVLTLGRLFTISVVVRPEQEVVTGGPYRFVRHPSYLGLLVLFFGLGLALGSLASAVVMVVVPGIGLLWRIRVEEAALRAGLGDRYVEYCRGRARLIPGVW